MADQEQDWTALALSQMSPEDKAKLTGKTAPPPDDLTQLVLSQMSPEDKAKLPAFEKKPPPPPKKDPGGWEDILPDVGGVVGSLTQKLYPPARATGPAGGVGLAAVGGAAGEGYRQLVKHGAELAPRFLGGGGGIEDVWGHLKNPETRKATYLGGVEGATEGRTNALKAGLKQGAIEAVGQGVARGAPALASGMKIFNASPAAKQLRNLMPVIGAVAGALKGGGWGAGGGAVAGRVLGSPQSFNAVAELVKQSGKLPIADLLRGLDAYRNRPNPEEEP